jgi:hypothetical protein
VDPAVVVISISFGVFSRRFLIVDSFYILCSKLGDVKAAFFAGRGFPNLEKNLYFTKEKFIRPPLSKTPDPEFLVSGNAKKKNLDHTNYG